MNTFAKFLPLALLLTACGSMRETTQVRDDVYDILDRTALAAVASTPTEDTAPTSTSEDDYYDPNASRNVEAARGYYDMAYNDPYYYNYGRFGFGTSIGGWGPGYGMGFSYGWPTSWGSMSIGYGYGMGYSPWGYNPYWSNSWMSGYGYGDPWGYYGYGNYGWGWGGYGYGYGYGPYQGPWGGCYGCYEPIGYSNNVVYGHRPSMTGSSGNMNTSQVAPRAAYRNPASLIQPAPTTRSADSRVLRPVDNGRRPATNTYTRPGRQSTGREQRPARSNWSFGDGGGNSRGGGIDMPSRSGGGGGGGGRTTTSPRPR